MTGITAIIMLSILTSKSTESEMLILMLVICLVYGSSEYLRSSYSLSLNFNNVISTINASLEKVTIAALGIIVALYVAKTVIAYFGISI